MMTKKHIIDELKGAAAEAKSDYQFNEDCIEEAIEFMFDTYVEDYDQALDTADVVESDVMDSISEEKWPAIVKKAKKDLKDKGSFENEAVEFLLQDGLDNNYDEIHEGGADSSIGGIILKEIDYEDDEDDDSLDESSEDDEDEEDDDDEDGPVEFDWVADVYNDFVDDVCEEAGYPEDLDVDRIYDDFCDLLDEWNEGEGRDEYDDVEDYLKAHLNINDYLPEDDEDEEDDDEDEEDDEE